MAGLALTPSLNPERPPVTTGRGRMRLAFAAGSLVVALIAATYAVPQWLSPQDPLARCAALVVLNGDYPFRADEAARLFREGVAPEIWLTIDPRSGTLGSDAGTDSNARYLEGRGVPRDAIRVLPGTAVGTSAELAAVRSESARRRADCVVVITSPLHARRVKLTWGRADAPSVGPESRLIGAAPRLVVRHSAEGGYAGWRTAARELALCLATPLGIPR